MEDQNMTKTAEKTAEPTLALEGAVIEPSKPVVKGRALAAHKVQPVEKAPVASVTPSETAALLNMINAAAANPAVDVDKLERLVAMRDRAVAAEKEEAFNEAMRAAQAEMEPVRKDALNPSTKSKYASSGALDRALRPIYTKHGFGLSYDTEDCPKADYERVVCYLTCKGHTRKPHIDMPADGKGAKGGDVMTKTHAAGSAVTYGMRYLLKMIFNIATHDDDDGNAAGKTAIKEVDDSVPKITPEQVIQLHDKCEAVGCSRPNFLKWAKVAAFEHIPAEQYDGCMTGLSQFKAAK
jgi:hypothetical protein